MVIKRRLPSYRYESDFKQGQIFSPLEVQYHFNASKNILEELPDKVDTDKKIQSFKNFALDRVLDRFLPSSSVSDVLVDRYNEALDDLDVLIDAAEFAEELRVKYDLSDDLSYIEVLNQVKAYSEDVAEKMKAAEAEKMKAAEDVEKGGDGDAQQKEIEQKSVDA